MNGAVEVAWNDELVMIDDDPKPEPSFSNDHDCLYEQASIRLSGDLFGA